MGQGTDAQTIAELKAQNDRLMSEQIITRNLLNAQNKEIRKIEQRIAGDEVTAGTSQVMRATADAAVKGCRSWLNDQHAKWQRACDDLFRACFLTDQMYNTVMAALPSPSVLEAVVNNLVTTIMFVNPEFSMLGKVMETSIGSMKDKSKEQKERLLKIAKGAQELISEAFEKGKEEYEKGEPVERHKSQLKAALPFFQDQMDACSATSSWITDCWTAYNRALDRVPVEQAIAVTNAMYVAWTSGMTEAKHYLPGQVVQLSYLFLYDLLRGYCRENVKITVKTLRTIGGDTLKIPISRAKALQLAANDDIELVDFDELDSAKREVMYDFFKKIERLGRRPEIADDKDLLTNWVFAD